MHMPNLLAISVMSCGQSKADMYTDADVLLLADAGHSDAVMLPRVKHGNVGCGRR